MNFSDEQLIRAWKELSDEQRLILLILYLIDVERLSEEKVAEIMGLPRVIVKNRAIWARMLLKNKLLHIVEKAELIGNKK